MMRPPTLKHLARLYYELSLCGARAVGTKEKWPYGPKNIYELFCLACEFSRYDPRLLGVLIELLESKWTEMSPYLLRQHMLKMNCPQTLGVIFSFSGPFIQQDEFSLYSHYVMTNIFPVDSQLYFISLYAPASQGMVLSAKESLDEYSVWGYLSRERPVVHGAQRLELGHWGPLARKNILERLIQTKKKLSISDYLEAVGHTITRQQALIDLKNLKGLKLKGAGRGALWVSSQSAPGHRA